MSGSGNKTIQKGSKHELLDYITVTHSKVPEAPHRHRALDIFLKAITPEGEIEVIHKFDRITYEINQFTMLFQVGIELDTEEYSEGTSFFFSMNSLDSFGKVVYQHNPEGKIPEQSIEMKPTEDSESSKDPELPKDPEKPKDPESPQDPEEPEKVQESPKPVEEKESEAPPKTKSVQTGDVTSISFLSFGIVLGAIMLLLLYKKRCNYSVPS
jgi:LPXTG-motif cell wall-anchored protein